MDYHTDLDFKELMLKAFAFERARRGPDRQVSPGHSTALLFYSAVISLNGVSSGSACLEWKMRP